MGDSLQSVMNSFRKIVRALRASSRSSETAFGLRTAQFFVLQQIKTYEPLSLNELAGKTFSHQSTVSVVVDGLVKLGYVSRVQSIEDRRRLVLKTTDIGKSLIKKKRLTVQEKFANSLMKMTPQKRHMFAKLLEEFVANADCKSETPHFFFEEE